MKRVFTFVYGIAAYLLFLAVFLWFIAFVGDIPLVKTVNTGAPGDMAVALVIDLLLIAMFGLQHSIMARPGFKRVLTRWVPAGQERSTYVWISSLALGLVMWQWHPIDVTLWQASGNARVALYVIFACGWSLLLVSTFLTDHFELFGLKQSWFSLLDREMPSMRFQVVLFYRAIRHPMMLGFLIALWSVPTMTLGSVVLAASLTLYILIGIKFEERDLEESLGASYQRYKLDTPMLLPRLSAKDAAKRAPAR